MRGVDGRTSGAYLQASQQLADALKTPLAQRGRLTPEDRASTELHASQVMHLNTLAEQLLGAYRAQRQAAERLVAELRAAEARVEREILMPNRTLLELIDAVRNPPQAR